MPPTMFVAIALLLHLVAAVVWVGGMFFAYVCLRPVAAELLEPPRRLNLWNQTLSRFFPWVWGAVILLSVTGYWLVVEMGGFGSAGAHVHAMLVLGVVMIVIFLYIYFVPYRQLRGALSENDIPAGAKHLGRIRTLVGTNLVLGLLQLAVVRLLRGF